ncbi:hypothetical protein F5B17DRAFT_380115 [Nemania serpens]|nr:hypothetical protein F5B17DRAFT_380115 [Nemania serpens]
MAIARRTAAATTNAALTNLGPLPTDFALPPSCAREMEEVYKVITTEPAGWYYLLQGPIDQTSCYPSGYNGNSRQYYSPARCPTGYLLIWMECVSAYVMITYGE